jgi:hypothetical protein
LQPGREILWGFDSRDCQPRLKPDVLAGVVPVSSREVGAPDNRRDQAVVPLHQKAKRIAIAASGPGRKLTVDRGGFVSGFHVSDQ